MKICYLSNSAIGSRYASSIQIVKMCEAFSEIGNEVVLITRINPKKKINEIFNLCNVKSKFSVRVLDKFKSFPLGINYYLFSLVSIIISFKHKPYVYITRNFFTCFLLILFKKKVILELHHDMSMESRLVRFLLFTTKYLNLPQVIKIVAITNGIKQFFVKKYFVNKDKIVVLPSGSSLNKKKSNFSIKKKKNFNIGYFGTLYESRGAELIYKLAKIDNKNQYYLFGDKKKLKNNKKYDYLANLNLREWIPYKDISEFMAKMDILLMPYVSSVTTAGNVGDISKYTSPLKLFDYLTAGKVIICSNYKVLKEVISNNKNAIFIKNFTKPISWKYEIQKIKNQPHKHLIMSRNNYKLSRTYTLNLRAKKILDGI